MERTTKMTKTKGKNQLKTSYNNINECSFSELRKVRSKNTRKTSEKKLMVQLHHFANLTKSTTSTKAAALNLTGESKAILENDYFKLINLKQSRRAEFVANPFVINKTGADFSDKIGRSVAFKNKFNHTKKEFKDLVSGKFKAKDKLPKSPFAVACHNINSMISIKDYERVFCKKVFETRLFINGILVYDTLKRHYSGVSVARNCFKKKFINKLDKATKEIFPEMESFKTTNNNKDNRFLQNVIEFYENQENDVNLFNEQIIRINVDGENNGDDEVVLECNEDIEERSITPIDEYFSPESFETPPSQHLVAVDRSAKKSTKYQKGFYEKDAKSGKTSLFEVPQSFKVDDTVNRSVFKRIVLSNEAPVGPSCSKTPGCVETARSVAAGRLQINDLDTLGDLGASPTTKKQKMRPKKRLFQNFADDTFDLFDFRPLVTTGPNDDEVFVRPTYSPKEFTAFKKKHHSMLLSPREQKYLDSLKVDELDLFLPIDSAETLKNLSKIKTPEHQYFPFIQFNRK